MGAITQFKAVRRELDSYVAEFVDCIKTKPSRAHFRTFLYGQLSGLERKSVEPIALEFNVPPRTLQEFFNLHRWDEARVRTRHQQRVAARMNAADNIAVVDETSHTKSGDQTPGVKRQYSGEAGKIDNCIVTVHLGVADEIGNRHAMLDGELYLPHDWIEDAPRRQRAGIPDAIGFRTKPQIAIDQLRRARDTGVEFGFVTADEGYGNSAEFRRAVHEMEKIYVLEVKKTHTGLVRPSAAKADKKPREAQSLRVRDSDATYHVKDTQRGPEVWHVRDCRWQSTSAGDGSKRLLVAQNPRTGEIKYFITNAPPAVSLTKLLRAAFSRWRVERLFQDAKQEIGLTHFEGRSFRGLCRHLILSLISLQFLLEQTEWLREKKFVLERVASSANR